MSRSSESVRSKFSYLCIIFKNEIIQGQTVFTKFVFEGQLLRRYSFSNPLEFERICYYSFQRRNETISFGAFRLSREFFRKQLNFSSKFFPSKDSLAEPNPAYFSFRRTQSVNPLSKASLRYLFHVST